MSSRWKNIDLMFPSVISAPESTFSSYLLTRLLHGPPTAAVNLAALTPLFLASDLDYAEGVAVTEKPSKKCRPINYLHRLAANSGEMTGLTVHRIWLCRLPGSSLEIT